jgi:hypothetical protein
MSPQTRERVERTRAYLLQSPLPEDTKDGLQGLLDAASAATNGTADKIGAMAEALLALSLHEVKQAVRMPAALDAAVSRHASACPLRGGQSGAALSGWAGRIAAFCAAIRPVAWPLGIAASVWAFSPHAPALIQAIVK